MPTDEDLSRMAEAALLEEARRGAQRAESCGPSGWLKPKVPSTNKRFLQNILLGAVSTNRLQEKKAKMKNDIKRQHFQNYITEKNKYKRQYIKASTKPKVQSDSLSTTINNVNKIVKLQTNKKSTSKVNGLSWSEDGLEFSTAKTISKNQPKIKSKPRSLQRNISFISSSETDSL